MVAGRLRGATVIPAVSLAVLAFACRSDPAPPYTRLRGPAPSLDTSADDRTVLVVFWASWCEPCRLETPSLRRFAAAPPAGIDVVVIGEDLTLEDVRRFFGGEPPPEWHFRLDDHQQLLTAFRAETLPAAFLVSNRQLVARFKGVHDWTSRAMEELIRRLAAENRPTRP